MVPIIVTIIMMVISYSIGRFGITLTNANIGISFTKFMIILLMYWFSIPTAMIIGVILYLVEFFGQNYWNTPVLIILPNILLMPLYGAWVPSFDIRWAGLVLVVVANAIETVGTMFLGRNPAKVVMYYATNILFNIPLFWTLGPFFVG